MRLLSISYKENDWELKNLKLGEVNLLVGKNAVGKSRTVLSTAIISHIISKSDAASKHTNNLKLSLKFSNKKEDIFEYNIVYKNKKIISENLSINNNIMIDRDLNEAKIKSIVNNQFKVVYPPKDELLLHVNRDIKHYPFLEDIYQWGNTYTFFIFSDIHPEIPDNKKMNHSYVMNQAFNFLDNNRKENIVKQLNYIGYDVEYIRIQQQGDLIFLDLKEKNIDTIIPFYALSQGTNRALYMLITLEFFFQRKEISTLVIDDFCEGLDYERATKLGKIVFQTCKENNVQLIASSNDMFLMDVVDIEYWNILQRDGNVVTSMNKHTHPDLFENFKFTGLSNFDFFASDYIKQKTQTQ